MTIDEAVLLDMDSLLPQSSPIIRRYWQASAESVPLANNNEAPDLGMDLLVECNYRDPALKSLVPFISCTCPRICPQGLKNSSGTKEVLVVTIPNLVTWVQGFRLSWGAQHSTGRLWGCSLIREPINCFAFPFILVTRLRKMSWSRRRLWSDWGWAGADNIIVVRQIHGPHCLDKIAAW